MYVIAIFNLELLQFIVANQRSLFLSYARNLQIFAMYFQCTILIIIQSIF